MNREQYIAALEFWFAAETAGAIAGEVAMLVRSDPEEKRKLDIFRRIEASNKMLCRDALQAEGNARPVIATSFYRNGYKLGLRFAEGDWLSFLDRFEATVHPEEFTGRFIDDSGNETLHEYEGVDMPLLRHLARHEASLAEFVSRERAGRNKDSTEAMERILDSKLCAGLVGPHDPVGW